LYSSYEKNQALKGRMARVVRSGEIHLSGIIYHFLAPHFASLGIIVSGKRQHDIYKWAVTNKYPPQVPLDSEGGEQIDKWVNMNAFVARLTSLSRPSDPLDFSLYGIWALRAALEDQNPENNMPPAQSIKAAAVWMIYASRAMWERSVSEQVYEGKTAREGTTLRGSDWKGCSKERWGTWKDRFSRIWERYEDGDIKHLVEKATQEMSNAERA
jgi:hypothetical protein